MERLPRGGLFCGWGSGFWVLGSGFWVLGSGFWVLGSGFFRLRALVGLINSLYCMPINILRNL
ncbi:hypothetical protein FCV82_08440 [Vibrio breoganii]|nr:hypothetical protein FCV82_08440 [Vibrio breoganii]